MGSEAEEEAEAELISTPKLPLFSIKQHNNILASPEHPGMLTPPLQTSLSVPFRWEEEPGRPRPCLALTTTTTTTTTTLSPKSLELPPRMLVMESSTKLPSPTTVLEGPYLGRQRFHSSFRMSSECYGSSLIVSPQRSGSFGAMVLSKKKGFKVKTWFGSWRRRVFFKGYNKEVSGGSYVFPSSSADRESDHENGSDTKTKVKRTKIRRGASFSGLTNYSRSHFWATVCEGLKQAVPWKNKKLQREM